MTKKEISNAELLTSSLVKGLKEKKGIEIVSLDLRKLKNTFAEFMVICSGTNNRQLEALLESAEEFARKETNERPNNREGVSENTEWVVLDYFNVVVHVFLEEKRTEYNLEELWGDAEIKKY